MDEITMIDGFRVLLTVGSFILALIGGIIVRDRQVSKRITDSSTKTHERIDAIKDDMNENFARKDDVRESIRRVERGIENLGQEMRQNHKDLTALIIKDKD